MNQKSSLLMLLASLLTGCATTNLNVGNDSSKTLSDNPVGTYSSYGADIEYDDKDKLYHLSVFVGGLGSCDEGAILYAKPKLDDFMKSGKFTSYKIIKGEYSMLPLSKCELFVRFNR